jgi:hypothetical protein
VAEIRRDTWFFGGVASALSVITSACLMDAFVYAPVTTGAAAGQGDAGPGALSGAGGTGGTGGAMGQQEPMIYGCRAAGEGGAEAVFMRIVDMASEVGDWLLTDRTCSAQSDCRTALLTPACDVEAALCVPCPLLIDRTVYSSLLIRCLADAVARCCVDPDAPRDCVFRGCIGGCGLQ